MHLASEAPERIRGLVIIGSGQSKAQGFDSRAATLVGPFGHDRLEGRGDKFLSRGHAFAESPF